MIGEITKEQAVYLLPDTDEIHVHRNCSFGLLGCDWSREDIMDLINKAQYVTRSGEIASGMSHGLVVWPPNAKYLSDLYFVETNMDRCTEIDKLLETEEATDDA